MSIYNTIRDVKRQAIGVACSVVGVSGTYQWHDESTSDPTPHDITSVNFIRMPSPRNENKGEFGTIEVDGVKFKCNQNAITYGGTIRKPTLIDHIIIGTDTYHVVSIEPDWFDGAWIFTCQSNTVKRASAGNILRDIP
jgi:hypothetical protein